MLVTHNLAALASYSISYMASRTGLDVVGW